MLRRLLIWKFEKNWPYLRIEYTTLDAQAILRCFFALLQLPGTKMFLHTIRYSVIINCKKTQLRYHSNAQFGVWHWYNEFLNWMLCFGLNVGIPLNKISIPLKHLISEVQYTGCCFLKHEFIIQLSCLRCKKLIWFSSEFLQTITCNVILTSRAKIKTWILIWNTF